MSSDSEEQITLKMSSDSEDQITLKMNSHSEEQISPTFLIRYYYLLD